MNKATPLENWWKRLDIWDRQQASSIPVEDFDGETALYLDATNRWWNTLSTRQKTQVHLKLTKEA